MSAPRAKKPRESNVISMVVADWGEHRMDQYSSVYSLAGFPWRLHLFKGTYDEVAISIECDKSSEAELWNCSVKFKEETIGLEKMLQFTSYDRDSWEQLYLAAVPAKPGSVIKMKMLTKDDGDVFKRRPTLSFLAPRDGILLIGKEKKRVHVNKESLAKQSPFFDRLFFGDFKEKELKEIPIKDVEHGEFINLLHLIFHQEGSSLTGENLNRVLQLADQFEIKIVEDCCITFLLSTASELSVVQKLLLSEQYRLGYAKDLILAQKYSRAELAAIAKAPELGQLSAKSVATLFKMAVRSPSPTADTFDWLNQHSR